MIQFILINLVATVSLNGFLSFLFYAAFLVTKNIILSATFTGRLKWMKIPFNFKLQILHQSIHVLWHQTDTKTQCEKKLNLNKLKEWSEWKVSCCYIITKQKHSCFVLQSMFNVLSPHIEKNLSVEIKR